MPRSQTNTSKTNPIDVDAPQSLSSPLYFNAPNADQSSLSSLQEEFNDDEPHPYSAPTTALNSNFIHFSSSESNSNIEMDESSYTVPTSENLIINLGDRTHSSGLSTNLTNTDLSTAPYSSYLSTTAENNRSFLHEDYASTQQEYSFPCSQPQRRESFSKSTTSFYSNQEDQREKEKKAFQELTGLKQNCIDVVKISELLCTLLPNNLEQLKKLSSQSLLQVYRQWKNSNLQSNKKQEEQSALVEKKQIIMIKKSLSVNCQQQESLKSKNTFFSKKQMNSEQSNQIEIEKKFRRQPSLQDFRTMQTMMNLRQSELKKKLGLLCPDASKIIQSRSIGFLRTMLSDVLEAMLDPNASQNTAQIQRMNDVQKESVSTILLKNALINKFPQIKQQITNMTQADIQEVYLDTIMSTQKQSQLIQNQRQIACKTYRQDVEEDNCLKQQSFKKEKNKRTKIQNHINKNTNAIYPQNSFAKIDFKLIQQIKKQLCIQLPTMKKQIFEMNQNEIQAIYSQTMKINVSQQKQRERNVSVKKTAKRKTIKEILSSLPVLRQSYYLQTNENQLQIFQGEKESINNKKEFVTILSCIKDSPVKQSKKPQQIQKCDCACCKNSQMPKQLKQIFEKLMK